jgi:hypothetical protein
VTVAVVLSTATLARPAFVVDRDPDGTVHVRCPGAAFTMRLGIDDAMQLHTALTDALPPREDPRP